AESGALAEQLNALFTHENGPGPPGATGSPSVPGGLCGVLSPHIDLRRGGPAFAWAYKQIIEQSQAELFVIFGTAHNPMRNLFSLTRKDFETPLGTVSTDRKFVSRLAAQVTAAPGCGDVNLFADELAHRQEHSIELQVVFLQHVLAGRRPFTIVPVLVGSFHEFVEGRRSPLESPQVAAFVAAMRRSTAEHPGKVCYISGGDLAHIGQRFGDRAFLNTPRLKAQADDDRTLLAAACRPDAEAFFEHVARQQDRHRICGLSPTYTMLRVMEPKRGQLLRYDQAVELDGTSCVSFASAAFYNE
ncbi:MAG TPA: AmmeMemoRadiSam system protein B, partial [Pirellulales bacterium]|nr:AmmeMemoRadiSam system protein B [Pirellulales bacterium]